MEHFPYGKQFDDFLDQQNMQKRPQTNKPICVGLESEKYEYRIPNFEKYLKFAHAISVQNGSYTFPNELARFRI